MVLYIVHFLEHVYWYVQTMVLYRATTLIFCLGVVVENFSYVFQLAGSVSITREEMRSFKKDLERVRSFKARLYPSVKDSTIFLGESDGLLNITQPISIEQWVGSDYLASSK